MKEEIKKTEKKEREGKKKGKRARRKEESQKVRKGETKISKCKFYEKHLTAK